MQIYCNYKKAVNELKLIVFEYSVSNKRRTYRRSKKIISFDDIKISDKKNKVWFSNVKTQSVTLHIYLQSLYYKGFCFLSTYTNFCNEQDKYC